MAKRKSVKDRRVYMLADELTKKDIEKACINSTGVFMDVCRKALGVTTKRALTITPYGAKLKIARKMLSSKFARRHYKVG